MNYLEGRSEILTKGIRKEIIESLYRKILQQTRRPTSLEYNTVCQALVRKFPVLMDEDEKARYATWKQSLRWKFRNGRREKRAAVDDHDNDDDDSERRKRKRRKTSQTQQLLSEEECREQLELIKSLHKEKNPSKKYIKKAMRATFPNRRQWIVQKNPPHVYLILDEYPFLKKQKWLKQELKWITDEGQEVGMAANWKQQRDNVLAHYKTNGSASVKAMYPLIEKEKELYPDSSEEIMDYHGVEVLAAALSPKSTSYIQVTYSDDADINDIIKECNQSAPFIIRLQSNEGFQYLLLVEGEVLYEGSDLRDAYDLLICTYYVFDISYPKYLSTALIFMQHYIFNIPYKTKLPISVSCLHTNLAKY